MLKQKKLIFILGLLGFLVSSYLFYADLKNNSPFCFPNSSCDFVLKSKYSNFLGFPVALWGIIYFGSVLILYSFDKFKFLLKAVSSLGFLFSLYLIYLQVFILKSFCPYCLLADISAIFIFILTLVKI